jgi:phage shock protein PspC (stress-responsive transcriptional regulator)
MLEIQPKAIQIIWVITGFPQYGFGTDKKLYNVKRGRVVRKVLKGYTTGYNLNGKFYSLQRIKSLIKRPEKITVPF